MVKIQTKQQNNKGVKSSLTKFLYIYMLITYKQDKDTIEQMLSTVLIAMNQIFK